MIVHSVYRLCLLFACVLSLFGLEIGMRDMTVLVPDHCLSQFLLYAFILALSFRLVSMYSRASMARTPLGPGKLGVVGWCDGAG